MGSFIESATALFVILWHGALTVLGRGLGWAKQYWPLFIIIGIVSTIYFAL